MGLSSGERILLFLSTARPNDDPFGTFDQETISRECGIGRTHIPRSVKPLLERSLVAEDKGRSPGRNRLVKRYSITLEGLREANSISDRINSMRITLVGPDGLKNTTDPVSILSLANAYLARIAGPVLGLPLILSTDSDVLPWESVLALAKSRESVCTVDLPPGWRSLDPPLVPDDYLGRPREESELSAMLDIDDPIILEGRPGSGRRTLLCKVMRDRGLKALWIERGIGDTPASVRSGSDILVIMDELRPVPASILLREYDPIPDPRAEGDWDEALRSMKLVIVRSIGTPINAPTLTMGPIGIEVFSRALSELGLSSKAAEAIHKATNGSASALTEIKGMAPSDRAELEGEEYEKALFRLLISLGRSKSISKVT